MKEYVFSIETEGMVVINIVPKNIWDKTNSMTLDYEDEDLDMIMNVLEPIGIFELGTWVFETKLSKEETRAELTKIDGFSEVLKIN